MIAKGINVPRIIKDCKEVTGLPLLGGDDGLPVVLALFLFKDRSNLKLILARDSNFSSTKLEHLSVHVYLFASRVMF